MTVTEILEAHANGKIFTSMGRNYQLARVKPDSGLTIEDCKNSWPYNAYEEAGKLIAECSGCLIVFDAVAGDDPREAKDLGA